MLGLGPGGGAGPGFCGRAGSSVELGEARKYFRLILTAISKL